MRDLLQREVGCHDQVSRVFKADTSDIVHGGRSRQFLVAPEKVVLAHSRFSGQPVQVNRFHDVMAYMTADSIEQCRFPMSCKAEPFGEKSVEEPLIHFRVRLGSVLRLFMEPVRQFTQPSPGVVHFHRCVFRWDVRAKGQEEGFHATPLIRPFFVRCLFWVEKNVSHFALDVLPADDHLGGAPIDYDDLMQVLVRVVGHVPVGSDADLADIVQSCGFIIHE